MRSARCDAEPPQPARRTKTTREESRMAGSSLLAARDASEGGQVVAAELAQDDEAHQEGQADRRRLDEGAERGGEGKHAADRDGGGGGGGDAQRRQERQERPQPLAQEHA